MKRQLPLIIILCILFLFPFSKPEVIALPSLNLPDVYALSAEEDLFAVALECLNAANNWENKYTFIRSEEIDCDALLDLVSDVFDAASWRNFKSYSYSYSSSISDSHTIYTYKISWTPSASEADEKASDIEAQRIINEIITPEMTQREKYKALHDYVILNCQYDTAGHSKYSGQTAWNALVEKLSVCNGYTKAFMLLCKKAGLNAYGAVGSAGGELHAWNAVYIDSGWKYIDLTWDDPTPDKKGVAQDTYFILTKAEISKDHSFDVDLTKYYKFFLDRDFPDYTDEPAPSASQFPTVSLSPSPSESPSAEPPSPSITDAPSPSPENSIKCEKSSARLEIGNSVLSVESYIIDGEHSFKLRDIALILNGSMRSFNLYTDPLCKSVYIVSGKLYTPNGCEFLISEQSNEPEAEADTIAVFLDGTRSDFETYIIGTDKYFKLKDLGQTLDFAIDIDRASDTFKINPSLSYKIP